MLPHFNTTSMNLRLQKIPVVSQVPGIILAVSRVILTIKMTGLRDSHFLILEKENFLSSFRSSWRND